jgi:hypothetical protein
MAEKPYAYVRRELKAGNQRKSLVSVSLEEQNYQGEEERDLKFAAASFFAGMSCIHAAKEVPGLNRLLRRCRYCKFMPFLSLESCVLLTFN